MAVRHLSVLRFDRMNGIRCAKAVGRHYPLQMRPKRGCIPRALSTNRKNGSVFANAIGSTIRNCAI